MENTENFKINTSAGEESVKELPTREIKRPDTAQKVAVSWTKNLLLYVHDLIYFVAFVIVLTLLFLRVVVVSGTSMNQTLLDGDYLFVLSNAFYQNPEPGDIVVISKESFEDGEPIVKRVIATEGQWVDIDFEAGIVYVGDSLDNMQPLEEEYTTSATTMQEGTIFPLLVEEDCLFVLGDNRSVSRDSRDPAIGQVDKQEVLGKVVFIFIPGVNGTNDLSMPADSRDWSRFGVVD